MNPISKIAQLLRTPEKVILDLEKKMEKVSGKRGVIEKIIQENEEKVRQKLKELGFGSLTPKAEQVYQALIAKTKNTDQALFEHFRQPEFTTAVGCRTLINATKELTDHLFGFYLKKDKAIQLLKLNPPKNIMAALGYGTDVEKMLTNEDPLEIFCSLRFAEDEHWLNDVFFQPYESLKKEDFKERDIEVRVLPEKWLGIGQKFLGKKLHHMSHLKELGIVFVIPTAKHGPGETLYLFFMTLHYLYEVDWYSRLFKMYSFKKDFGSKMISALRGQVSGLSLPDKKKVFWRIIVRYLAKDDPNDPRLFEPHISPEAWHYAKTSLAIQKFAARFPNLGLNFWQELDEVGEYFPSQESKEKTLISFNLYDNGISLLKQIGLESKYLYHLQEALWNRIFIEYLGEEVMDKLMMENL